MKDLTPEQLEEIEKLMTQDINIAKWRLGELLGHDILEKKLAEERRLTKTNLFIPYFLKYQQGMEVLGGLIHNKFLIPETFDWNRKKINYRGQYAVIFQCLYDLQYFNDQVGYKELSTLAKEIFNIEVSDKTIKNAKGKDDSLLKKMKLKK